jgi:hypothetical protein
MGNGQGSALFANSMFYVLIVKIKNKNFQMLIIKKLTKNGTPRAFKLTLKKSSSSIFMDIF